MNYYYNRQEIESAIDLLAESYPKAFFLDPEKRRPLKHNISIDLAKDGVALAPELMQAAIKWYESHFGYQLTLQAGVKRIDLKGKEVGTVTEPEERTARRYIHDRKQEERERKQEEQKRCNANVVVEKVPTAALPIAKLPMMNINIPKETTMPVKNIKPNDPLAPIQTLLDSGRSMFEQPEPLRRPLAIAALRVLISEIEKTITTMENDNG